MKLITLGTGSSGNGYLLENNGKYLLLDAGCSWRDILTGCGFATYALDGCLVTHSHKDHSKYISAIQRHGVECFTWSAVNKDLKETLTELSPDKYSNMSGWRVLPFALPHDGTPNTGFVIQTPDDVRRFIYMTDFEYSPYTFKNQKIDTWLIECNYNGIPEDDAKRDHVLKGHASLMTIKKLIMANKNEYMKNIILCHISETNGDPVQMQKVIKQLVGDDINVYVAEKKGVINL